VCSHSLLAICSYSVQDAKMCPNPPPAPKEEANESFAVDVLEEVDGAAPHFLCIVASFPALATAHPHTQIIYITSLQATVLALVASNYTGMVIRRVLPIEQTRTLKAWPFSRIKARAEGTTE
jgi:hypothetical protein